MLNHQTADGTEAIVAETLDEAPVFDGHNDLPYALRERFDHDPEMAEISRYQPALQTDLPSLRSGGVGAQFWSVYVSSAQSPHRAVRETLDQIDCVIRMSEIYPETFCLAETATQIRQAWSEGRIASLLGMEGGHSIDSSLATLRIMRRLGVRYMTLTHNDNTPWAASATGEPVDFGLTKFGRSVVREMNQIGMLVDLSHVHEATMNDALDVTTRPVIFSHSSCRTVTEHPRNVPDDVLQRLRQNGGVQMITFVPVFVSNTVYEHSIAQADAMRRLGLPGSHAKGDRGTSESSRAMAALEDWKGAHPKPQATIEDVVRHLEHAREMMGVDHLGLGSDFDGIPTGPGGLERVSEFPALLTALAKRGWSKSDLRKLTSENTLRVIEEADVHT